MKYDRNPPLTKLLAGGARWGAVFTVAFLCTFPFWARPMLAVLGFILEGLDNFGSGM